MMKGTRHVSFRRSYASMTRGDVSLSIRVDREKTKKIRRTRDSLPVRSACPLTRRDCTHNSACTTSAHPSRRRPCHSKSGARTVRLHTRHGSPVHPPLVTMNASTAQDWEDFPLFAPQGAFIPKLEEPQSAQQVSSAVGALSHLLYDEETPLEASELLRDEGNRHFKRGRR